MSLRAVRRVLYGLGAILLLVLAVTGVWLWFRYRPAAAEAWNDTLNPQLQGMERMRIVHRLSSNALLFVALMWLALLVADRTVRGRWPLAVWIFVATAAASFTGFLLPWDQLALASVTVGDDFRGMGALWDDDVLFVLIDGVEVAPVTIRRWAVVHVVLPVVALLVPAAAMLFRRSRGAGGPSPSTIATRPGSGGAG